ncbi:MAG: FAD-binding oxidoreductase [Acidimicrobiales bacterium]
MLTPGPGAPTPPIAIAGGSAAATGRLVATRGTVPDDVVDRLRSACAEVVTDPAALVEASRDWWPLAMTWAADGGTGAVAEVVCRPETAAEVAAVLAVANVAAVPVTPAAGRSGVLGGSVPVHGGIVVDLTALAGVVDVDPTSLVLDVRAGTFGHLLEAELHDRYGCTLGHWPQSIALSTVGGWLACRSAGQLSNRYGKIEDMVLGLDVVLADGRQITTGGTPHAAIGPDLTQLFVGSEGTLGVITGARLRLHPTPDHAHGTAWGFAALDVALDAMRRIVRRGVVPAALRLYDDIEAARSYDTPAGTHLLLARDEGDPAVVELALRIVDEAAAEAGAVRLDPGLVDIWMAKRNDVAALEALISRGYVVDTMEVTGRWRDLPAIYTSTISALHGVPGCIAASAHQSHSYPEGGCLYFSFAGALDGDGDGATRTALHGALWDAGQRAALAAGAGLSHHHGVGLGRGRFVADALGPAHEVAVAVKRALDPKGILNPAKLGLPSPFGTVTW